MKSTENECARIVMKVLRLLPNTELTKYKIQLIFIGDLPRDGSEVVQALPDIQCQEIAGEAVVEAALYVTERLVQLLEGFVVA